ncbi:hypothetical protein MAN_09705, partial [Metarhizium hybridum]
MTKGGKLPNAKPKTKDRNNATTDNNFKALYSIRDNNHKTGNTNCRETRVSNQATRDLEKSASMYTMELSNHGSDLGAEGPYRRG